jgi:hypothetical protein
VADIAGAALAGMGLSHIIARGIIAGLAGRRAVFQVTRRSDAAAIARPRRARGMLADVREETALLLALLACIAALALQHGFGSTALTVWMGVLGMQALPYAAALTCALLSHAHDRQPVRSAPGRRKHAERGGAERKIDAGRAA